MPISTKCVLTNFVPWINHPSVRPSDSAYEGPRQLRFRENKMRGSQAKAKELGPRKQPTFRVATAGFPSKWPLRNNRKKMQTDDLSLPRSGCSASDWPSRWGNLLQLIRSTTQFWVVTRHQYGISALVFQTSFRKGTSDGVAKCRLFCQATKGASPITKRGDKHTLWLVYLSPSASDSDNLVFTRP